MLRLWYMWAMFPHVSPCFPMFHHVSPCFHVQFFSYLSPESMTHGDMCRMHDAMTSRWVDWLPHWPYQPVWQTRVELRCHWAKLDRIRNWKRVPAKKQTTMWSHPWVRCEFSGLIEHAFKVQWTCRWVRNSWIFADRGGWWVGARSKFIFGAFKDAEKREGYWWVLMRIGMISTAVWDC